MPMGSLSDDLISYSRQRSQMNRLCNQSRGSYIRAQVLLNLFNELGKMLGLPSILSFFVSSLINSIKQEHEC